MNKYTKQPVTTEQRFWPKVDKRSDDECWNWLASKDTKGYGVILHEGVLWRAHRVSWLLHNKSLNKDDNVLHKCDNPACVNPSHLFLGTQIENLDDMTRKGRRYINIHSKGERNPNVKLSIEDVSEIKTLYFTTTMNIDDIAKRFDVNWTTIQRIVSGKGWIEHHTVIFSSNDLSIGYFADIKYPNYFGMIHLVYQEKIPLCKSLVPDQFQLVTRIISDEYITCKRCKKLYMALGINNVPNMERSK